MMNGEHRGLVGWGWRILGWNIVGNFSFTLQKELRSLITSWLGRLWKMSSFLFGIIRTIHHPNKLSLEISFTFFVWLPHWNTRISEFKHVLFLFSPPFLWKKRFFHHEHIVEMGGSPPPPTIFLHLANFHYYVKKTYLRVWVTKPPPPSETWGKIFGSLLGSKLRRRVFREVLEKTARFLIAPMFLKTKHCEPKQHIILMIALFGYMPIFDWFYGVIVCMFFCLERFLSDLLLSFQKGGCFLRFWAYKKSFMARVSAISSSKKRR